MTRTVRLLGPARGRPRAKCDVITPVRIDWAQVMRDLKERGCSTLRAAKSIKASQCAAQNWAKGGEPGYAYGRALLLLHSRYCGAGLTIARCYIVESEKKAA